MSPFEFVLLSSLGKYPIVGLLGCRVVLFQLLRKLHTVFSTVAALVKGHFSKHVFVQYIHITRRKHQNLIKISYLWKEN